MVGSIRCEGVSAPVICCAHLTPGDGAAGYRKSGNRGAIVPALRASVSSRHRGPPPASFVGRWGLILYGRSAPDCEGAPCVPRLLRRQVGANLVRALRAQLRACALCPAPNCKRANCVLCPAASPASCVLSTSRLLSPPPRALPLLSPAISRPLPRVSRLAPAAELLEGAERRHRISPGSFAAGGMECPGFPRRGAPTQSCTFVSAIAYAMSA